MLDRSSWNRAMEQAVDDTNKSGDREASADVAAILDGYSAGIRRGLLHLRALILQTAAETDGVGPIEETLKWGQPSYLTPATGSGSTIRIDAVKGSTERFAMYFHCQTDLMETFRGFYPRTFVFEGNRALHFRLGERLPETELKHCIALALTYHARRRAPARRTDEAA